MGILKNILPGGFVISPKARSAAGDIAQPEGVYFQYILAMLNILPLC
jgi:hypothetical protein